MQSSRAVTIRRALCVLGAVALIVGAAGPVFSLGSTHSVPSDTRLRAIQIGAGILSLLATAARVELLAISLGVAGGLAGVVIVLGVRLAMLRRGFQWLPFGWGFYLTATATAALIGLFVWHELRQRAGSAPRPSV